MYFLKQIVTRKIQELIFDVPYFLAKHKALGYLSEEGENLHCSVNKQLQQYQNVRDQSEKLQLVTNEELLSTADRSLVYVTPRPKCVCSLQCVFKKGYLPSVQKGSK